MIQIMPLPKVTIRGLQALLAVYEEQSFSRAADRENATQSGMSTQVKKLETTLDTKLQAAAKPSVSAPELLDAVKIDTRPLDIPRGFPAAPPDPRAPAEITPPEDDF